MTCLLTPGKVGHDVAKCWSLVVCSHCKKHGHAVDQCYELIGYLDKDGSSKGSSKGCVRILVKGNAAFSSLPSAFDPPMVGSSSSTQLFSLEQWKALLGLFGNSRVSYDRLTDTFASDSWIIDTGATHHVSGAKHWFHDLVDIFSYPVGLPNGSTVLATQKGCSSFYHYHCL